MYCLLRGLLLLCFDTRPFARLLRTYRSLAQPVYIFKMKFSLLAPTLLVQVSQLLPMVAFLSLLPNAGFAETAEDRPTIILVPGAFHQPLVYDKVVDLLHNAQYHNVYAIDLPSVGELATRDDDIWSVCAVLFKELEAGRNVLLVGNSYGGTVIGEAVKGLKDDQERVESDEENVGARVS